MQDLEQFYKENSSALFSFALSILGERQSAEDILHEVFVKLTKIDRSELNLKAYVYTMIRNKAMDYFRRQQTFSKNREYIFDLPAFVGNDRPNGEQEFLRQELHETIAGALDDLPEEQSEVIFLRLFSGMTFAEIAHINESTVSTLSSRYQTGLKNLRKILEDKYEYSA